METSARLAIEIADHHLAFASVEKRRDLARAIVNAISICEREVAEALVGRIGVVPDRETWWLVERKVQPPQYCVEAYTDLPSLTDDPWRAARFATEREAFDYRLRLSSLRDECKETEHVFINKMPVEA